MTIFDYNRYGLDIMQNNEYLYTIKNHAGETFLAEFKADNSITLLHWNYLHKQGKTHPQGKFKNIPDMLREVHSHGNRFFVKPRRNKIDVLFDQIARK